MIRNVISIVLFFFITTIVGLLQFSSYESEVREDPDKYEGYKELYSNNLVEHRLQKYRELALEDWTQIY